MPSISLGIRIATRLPTGSPVDLLVRRRHNHRVEADGGESKVSGRIRPLTEFERSLIESIWEPIRGALARPPKWPIWDYVARTYYRQCPDGPAAELVLAGLPTSPRPGNHGAYGLYWFDSIPPVGGPNPEQEIGLTIAGLYTVSRPGSLARMVADELAAIVSRVANRTEALEPDPERVAQDHIPFPPLTEWLSQSTREKPTAVPPAVAAKVLMKESARIPIRTFGGNLDGQIDVELSGPWLRAFLNVESADDYIRIVWPARDDVELPVPEQTPLTLLQTIDYFSYVVEATAVWLDHRRHRDHHLVRIRSLHSAAQLGLPASSRDEFNARVGAFWTILDHLDVPIVDIEEYEKRYETKGTFNALVLLLEHAAGEDATSRSDVARALKKIRDVRALRNEADHDAAESREAAIKARRRLGLPDLIWDWSEGWDVVRRQLASAFDTLIQAIQR